VIKNFDELKKQLSDLAGVINSFKSEAVQLRIVELVFQTSPDTSGEEKHPEESPRSRRRGTRPSKRVSAPPAGDSLDTPKKGRTGKAGPATVLDQLISEKYFASKRTLNDIIVHCSSKKARNFKPNELSSPLARFVRDGRLKRDKNNDGQYEYHQ